MQPSAKAFEGLVNVARLKQAEDAFLTRYPGGFANPELMTIRNKRHNVDKMIAFAQEGFAEQNFTLPDKIVKHMIAVVRRSSVISMFEKPRFRDVVSDFAMEEKSFLAHGLEELLHGNEQRGFEAILDLLKKQKLAKWALMTIFQAYYHPEQSVFIKPTTAKGIIQFFELNSLQYKPTPSWAFYVAYREILLEMKSKVDSSLSPTNIAFSWFLLLSFHNNLFWLERNSDDRKDSSVDSETGCGCF